jgi:hypothetical protein
VISFGHDGILPSQASVRIYVGDQENVKTGSKIYLYHYNYDTDKLEALPYASGYVVDKDGYITINIVHCSDYVVLSEEPVSNQITSLLDQITVKPIKKTIYLGGNSSETAIEVDLPSTLELVNSIEDNASQAAIGGVTIAYSSSNKKVATIDKAGKIKAVGEGKAVITTSITLYSGEVKIVKTSINIKKPYITLTSKKSIMVVGDSFTFKANAYGVDVNDIVWTTTEKSIIYINKKTGKAIAKSVGTDYVVAKVGNIYVKLKVIVK